MRQDARRHILAITLMVIGVGLAYGARAVRPRAAAYQVDFSNIPMEVLGLKGRDVPNDPADMAYLEAEAMRTIVYGEPPQAVEVSLIHGVSWRTVHTPEGCYPSAGWKVVWEHALLIPPAQAGAGQEPLNAKLMRVERDKEALLVLFVFAHKGGTQADWARHSWAVATGPPGAGGLSLMVTAPSPAGRDDEVQVRLKEFMRIIYPRAIEFWER